jgi:hypothetical protein
MNIEPRRMLLLQDPKTLTKEESWLQNAYANIIAKLIELALNPSPKIDDFSSMFIGLRSIQHNKYQYQALLEITSYIWGSKGGRGNLLEKVIAASGGPNASNGMPLSQVPQWIALAKNNHEVSKWNVTGSAPSLKFDLANIIEDRVIFLEIKNRVDSGGTSAREEALSKKFLALCKMIQNGEKVFVGNGIEMDMAQTLLGLGIKKIEMHAGFLFDVDGSEATIESDKSNGFYGRSRQLLASYYQKENHRFSVKLTYDESLQRLSFEKDGLAVSVNLAYGNDVTRKFTRDQLSLARALDRVFTRKWDDIWLALTLAIFQRSILLEYGSNHIKEIRRIYEQPNNSIFKKCLAKFMANQDDVQSLSECIKIINESINIKFSNSSSALADSSRIQLADCIYVYAAYAKRTKKVKSS